jgi:hypothetical protein
MIAAAPISTAAIGQIFLYNLVFMSIRFGLVR